MDEERFNKLEDNVIYLKTKLDNGLSSTVRKNEEQLNKIVEKQNQFEVSFYTMVAKNEHHQNEQETQMSLIVDNMQLLNDTQKGWNVFVARLIKGTMVALASVVVYLLANIDVIVHLYKHVEGILPP